MSKVLIFIFISSFFLMNSFGIGPNLYPLRLVLPIAFVFFLTVFFQKVFLLKQKVKVHSVVLFSMFFFVLMFVQTYAVTIIRVQLFEANYELNSILNFTFLMFLILTIYSLILSYPKEFLKTSKFVIFLFYLIYVLYSFYEITTGNHLPTSDLIDAPWWMRHVPTVVYFNSNDFAFVFTLMLMYGLSVFDRDKHLSSVWILALFVIHMFIMYKSQSRLSFLMSFFFFVYRYPKKIIFSSVLGLVLFFVGGYFLENTLYMQVMDDILKLKSDLSFNERQSTLVRLSLYKYAVLSVIPSFGFGYGIDYSAQYYQSINDANLHYIVDPHSFIFELLINSGLLATLFYMGLNIWILVKNWTYSNYDIFIQIIIFNLLLFSSSSSLFIWPIYLFLIIYICKTAQLEN
tara:strand:+ start:2449 stop:3654 length:1206 start_codon:yes stop_codon:yes gene_type:complete